ncbi:hypothetical protein ACQKNX_08110 [Lysinibacillus sp. NPDC093712]|uniref:hypothetical protein n=1 Tax=Lysinibacillus sp. NPDC093712 TaxID=3390579 RepID=UPI003D05B5BD
MINIKLDNIKVGDVFKNYKELCTALDEIVKGGDSKKYQLIDWERYFTYDKQGNKFIIKEIHESVKAKQDNRKSNNLLPFIDEMEILLLDLLIRKYDNQTVLSSSKLMLELCIINPNYHKYFMDRSKLSKMLDMDIGYVIDFYDTTNATFKSALNTVTKRLTSKKLLIHETVMMVKFIDTSIQITPTGHVNFNDVFAYDEATDTYINKNIKPKEIYRPATDEEREYILKVERFILESKYKADNIQEVFLSGKINNYYQDVSDILLKKLNIKKAYKANRYTYDVNELAKQKHKLLSKYQLRETQDQLNLKVRLRIDENSNKRYEKAIEQLIKLGHTKKEYRIENDYVDNINTIGNSLIDIHNGDSLKVDIVECEVLDSLL